MRTDRIPHTRVVGPLLVAVAVLLGGHPLSGQSLNEVVTGCSLASSSGVAELCGRTATGMTALARGLSIAQVGGSPVPASASTLGKRFSATPRYALAGRLGLSRLHTPNGGAAGGDNGARVLGISGTVVVGLTEGFTLQPTVGGVFAIDLLATVGTSIVDDPAIAADPIHWGYGVRFGVIRESFTLPGASISVMRVHGGGVATGFMREETPRPDPTLGRVDIESTTTTSVRATVGKEFLAFGLMGGAGWDRTSIDGRMSLPGTAIDPAAGGLEDDRVSFFGSISKTWLIAQLALEVGYVRGLDAPAGLDLGGFDPSSGSWQLSLGSRLTF